jgi:hypothetical protein
MCTCAGKVCCGHWAPCSCNPFFELPSWSIAKLGDLTKGHFTHEPRAVTVWLWEPRRKCPMAVPTRLQDHVVWSQTLKRTMKSYVTGPSTKCYVDEFPFMRAITHDEMGIKQRLWAFGVSSSAVWSKLGPAPPFHQWECWKCTGQGPSVSCVKWPFTHEVEDPWPCDCGSPQLSFEGCIYLTDMVCKNVCCA